VFGVGLDYPPDGSKFSETPVEGAHMKFDESVVAILKRKGTEVFSVSPHVLVYDALRELAGRDIGALLVTQHGRLVGILSERDYARKVILLGRSSTETEVKEVMSPAVCVATTDSIDSCLHLMTTARVRHLVVMDRAEVAGVVSIGDLVNWVISAQAETIDHLHGYIAAGYPG
jgi:CBS domain-containing protein